MDPANLIRAPLARQRPLTRGLRRRASTTVGHFKRVDCISEDVRPRDRVSAFEQGTASGSLQRLLVRYLLETSLRRSSLGQRRARGFRRQLAKSSPLNHPELLGVRI